MKNRYRRIALLAILLVISIGNFFRISSEAANIRIVDFLSILVIGVLAGLLIGIVAFPRPKE
jgi:hypothetical protein